MSKETHIKQHICEKRPAVINKHVKRDLHRQTPAPHEEKLLAHFAIGARRHGLLPGVDILRSQLQHTATHCNTLQHTATHYFTQNLLSEVHILKSPPQHTATHRNKLQHTATHRNTLQHTATYRNTLQHTATHSYTQTSPSRNFAVTDSRTRISTLESQLAAEYTAHCIWSAISSPFLHSQHLIECLVHYVSFATFRWKETN